MQIFIEKGFYIMMCYNNGFANQLIQLVKYVLSRGQTAALSLCPTIFLFSVLFPSVSELVKAKSSAYDHL